MRYNVTMQDYVITPSTVAGCITPPPSKSHTQRAILFATLAHGESTITHFLSSPDTTAMMQACRQLGAQITVHPNHIVIDGVAGKLHPPTQTIDAGNSGQVLRFITALCALSAHPVTLTGDASICHRRPMQPLISALTQLGAYCHCLQQPEHAPLSVQGPISAGYASLLGQDSQAVSALLMATPFLNGPSHIHVTQPGETPWIDLTLDWLNRLNIPWEKQRHQDYYITGNARINGFSYCVPGDCSALSYPLVAALLTQSCIQIHGIDFQDCQGDQAIIPILQQMGARLTIMAQANCLLVDPTTELSGMTIDVNPLIDALPILAVVGCYATGTTHLINAASARYKESNRISVMATELRKMGAIIQETADGLIIEGQPSLQGASLYTHQDHRVAMSLSVAAMAAKTPSHLTQTTCVEKSYPNFASAMCQLGANIREIRHNDAKNMTSNHCESEHGK